jgi:hypothetical protein
LQKEASSEGRFTVDDLFDLIFPDQRVDGYLCMVYHCYLDDSKDAKQSVLYVSAGFFALRNEWNDLRTAWNRTLKENGIEYYKSSEYNYLTGQFAKFRTEQYPPPTGRDAAKAIKNALQEVATGRLAIRGIGVSVPVEDYRRVCARPEADGVFGGNPYHRALESIMFEIVKMVRARPGHNMVAFVHDDESDFETLHKFYLAFKKKNRKTAKFVGGFVPLSDKDHPELQMADMIANSTLEVGIDRLKKGETDKARVAMKENINKLCWWDEHYMLSVLKHNLAINGKPIPFDIDNENYGYCYSLKNRWKKSIRARAVRPKPTIPNTGRSRSGTGQ